MKTLRALEDRRLAYTVGNHAVAERFVSKIGIVLHQCFHARTMPFGASEGKPVQGLIFAFKRIWRTMDRNLLQKKLSQPFDPGR